MMQTHTSPLNALTYVRNHVYYCVHCTLYISNVHEDKKLKASKCNLHRKLWFSVESVHNKLHGMSCVLLILRICLIWFAFIFGEWTFNAQSSTHLIRHGIYSLTKSGLKLKIKLKILRALQNKMRKSNIFTDKVFEITD